MFGLSENIQQKFSTMTTAYTRAQSKRADDKAQKKGLHNVEAFLSKVYQLTNKPHPQSLHK